MKRLAIFAGAGLLFLVVAAFRGRGPLAIFCGVTGVVLFLPGFLYVYVLTIWHWKDRYKGRHSDLWGALLLIETSGWFKLVYLFRHLLPDAMETVRYSDPDLGAERTSSKNRALDFVIVVAVAMA
jgi:hypothetical protein